MRVRCQHSRPLGARVPCRMVSRIRCTGKGVSSVKTVSICDTKKYCRNVRTINRKEDY